jgi:hypothetical protein
LASARAEPRPPPRHRTGAAVLVGLLLRPLERRLAGLEGLVGVEPALPVVLRLHVADVEEAVAADAEVDERRLDRGLDVDDPPLVDVADEVVLARPLDVELLEHPVFHDRDPALLRLRHVDEHFLFHARLPLGLSTAPRGGVATAASRYATVSASNRRSCSRR